MNKKFTLRKSISLFATIKFILPFTLILIFMLSSFNMIGQCSITQDVNNASLSSGQWKGVGESFTACQAGYISKVCHFGGQSPTRVRIIDNADPTNPTIIYDNTSPTFQADGSFQCHTVTSTVAINNGEVNGVMFDYPSGGPNWRFTTSGGVYSGSIFLNNNGTWSSNASFDLAFEVDIVPNDPLPVELTDFQAILTEQHTTLLSWQTASEDNNAGFQIERSNNARDWQTLDFVEGKGTTDLLQNYSYTDSRPVPSDNYYRLKQIDFDGQYEYSDVRIVKVGGDVNILLNIFPNPNEGQFTLSLHNPNLQKSRIKLFDSTGNMIWEQDFRGSEAVEYWEKNFDLPQREVYFVMTQVGDQVETKKVSVISEK